MINDVQWVVQSNLNSEGADLIEKACRELDIKYTPVQIIPFSDTLPDYDKSIPAIFYGSTTMMRLVRGEKGLFFDNDAFSIENLRHWCGEAFLNSYSAITTIRRADSFRGYWKTDSLFIRPNEDNKSFSGQVIKIAEMKAWFKQLQQSDDVELTMDTKVLLSEPKAIEIEWRLWIVNGKVIAASQYRYKGFIVKKEGCPEEIQKFAELICRIWTPHNVFCMDVCLLPGDSNPYIVETGCFNSCGFYAADVNNIVKEVTNYFKQTI